MKNILIAVTACLVAALVGTTAYAQHDHGSHQTPKPMKESADKQADHIFISYEEARQALIKGSMPGIKIAARHIGLSAKSADQPKLAELSAKLEAAPDLKAAQQAFALLSDEAIKYRETRCCNRPVVVYCSMEKKSWMQTDAKVIGNPYVDAKMRTCGEVKAD
ncbi:MAG: hypothetical protein NDJ92_06700 [Thermoanaerobaculia bacterium]|nr:hypothetical protein [Thermoanaerobaculia bacterium]